MTSRNRGAGALAAVRKGGEESNREASACFNRAQAAINAEDWAEASVDLQRAFDLLDEGTPNHRAFKGVIAFQAAKCLTYIHDRAEIDHDERLRARIRGLFRHASMLASNLQKQDEVEFDRSFPGALQDARKGALTDRLLVAESALALGWQAADSGDKAKGAELISKALERLDSSDTLQGKMIRDGHLRLAGLLNDIGRLEESADHAEWVLKHDPPADATMRMVLELNMERAGRSGPSRSPADRVSREVSQASALLDDVESQFNEFSRTKKQSIAGAPYFGDRTAFSEALTRQCERAESLFGEHKPGLARSAFLKGVIWQGHPDGIDIQYMQTALELGHDEFQTRLRLAIKEAERGSKVKAVEHYRRIVELKGAQSRQGAMALEEIGKLEDERAQDKPKASGGCFIATAALGSADAPEVAILSQFRDRILRQNAVGRSLIRAYYRTSPALAAMIAARPWARGLVRRYMVQPLSRLAERHLASRGHGSRG